MNKIIDKKRPKVSVVILDFLKSKRVCENVESLQKQETDFDFEVIIVDNSCNAENAEKINSLQKFENVQIQINKENVGYIKGNNQGAAVAKGEYLMIVNPDIVWPDNKVMQKLVDYMDKNPKVGVCGPKQVNDNDNSVAMTVRAFPNLFLQVARRTFLRNLPLIKKWVAHDEMQHLDYNKVQTVDWLQSSFWITRKTLWEKIGGLDNSYFIFMSDPEFCYRTWKAGYEVIFNPAVIVHADGRRASEGGFAAFFKKWTLRQHLKDALIYQMKHLFQRNPHKKV
ncbi:MAG: glycosyltransferase family 2 protein [Candidatus Altimarinota bacterium]